MIDYLLTRSNRKTVGITVKQDTVYVKAPKSMPKRIIDEFVEKNSKWILSKLNSQRLMYSEFKDILQYKKFIFRGHELLQAFNGGKKIKIEGDFLYLPEKSEKPIQKLLTAAYKKSADLYLRSRVNYYSQRENLQYSGIKLTNARTKWGSCSSEGQLRLNWRLILLPDFLSDYVIVHELCHTKHLDHSEKFWYSVSQIIPDYKTRRQELKRYVPLIEICR